MRCRRRSPTANPAAGQHCPVNGNELAPDRDGPDIVDEVCNDASTRTAIDVSVIIAALNAESTIGVQLEALATQSFDRSWEVIVADNGSTDATKEVSQRYSDRLPHLRVIDASATKGAGPARNAGAETAAGALLCFCDADDVADSEWLRFLFDASEESDIVAGQLEIETLNPRGVRLWSPAPRASQTTQVQEWAPSSNMAIPATVFTSLGGFDPSYIKAQDVELSRRARAAGYTIGYCPEAIVHYRFRTTLAGVLQQGYRTGRGHAQAHNDGTYPSRPIGASLRSWLWLLTRTPTLLSNDRRGLWIRRAGEAAGRIAGSAKYRVRYL